jgi:hypothetical protein
MEHTFLLQPGRWMMQGNWLERNNLTACKGLALVLWDQENWFSMATKLTFPNSDRPEISCQYRGRMHDGERHYTFLLQHNIFGHIEGEGWICPDSIVQHYWVVSDSEALPGNRQKRSGFETLYRLNENQYYLTSSILAGHFLDSTMEASLERQPSQV